MLAHALSWSGAKRELCATNELLLCGFESWICYQSLEGCWPELQANSTIELQIICLKTRTHVLLFHT
jgi:hypothetical protein